MQKILNKICEENTERAFQRCADLPQFFCRGPGELMNILTGCIVSKTEQGLHLFWGSKGETIGFGYQRISVDILYTELDKFMLVMEHQAAGITNSTRNSLAYHTKT